jgi:surfactin synthase thioesterase subunit
MASTTWRKTRGRAQFHRAMIEITPPGRQRRRQRDPMPRIARVVDVAAAAGA